MAKKMLIDATHAEETRVVVVDGTKVEEFDFESENKRQLAGNIYLAKVTRVEPSLQAAFVDYGGNRHGFLAFSEIHPDYYQIPVADREALLAEEKAYAEALEKEEEKPAPKRRRTRVRSRSKAERAKSDDAVAVKDTDTESTEEITSLDVIDLGEDDTIEGSSPMELVSETPVETPASSENGIDEDSVAPEESDQPAEEIESRDAAARDETIESVADDDAPEEIRPPRKPRPRRYKIQEVIKVRQILLVQVVKEERGNKGAALTTYLSLAGRYCVLMPNTARGGGISRKITNAVDRKKLKQIAAEIDVPDGAGLIVRTAGAKRTKAEIKRDYEYLQRLWEQIRELTLKSIAPAKIYEEGNLIKRSIRDLYNREIDEVLVEGEEGYRTAKDFMKMIMPSHAKNVKHYTDPLPLLARYQVESYLAGMFNPTVQLKSGGYIVIGVTEALVAIDVNSGRATKEGSIEETALKTNLEAAEEVARQLRLRDLAGLIVIDFIDMEERRNNTAVEKRLKDKLKSDRARIQVGRISGFGLLEMSRQRLRPGMIETTTQLCSHCHGTGLVRSDDNLALSILRQIEEEGVRRRSREVLLKAPVGIVNFLMNSKREHVAQIESRYGLSVRLEADPFLVSPDFSLEKFKTATRTVAASTTPVVSIDASVMEPTEDADVVETAPEAEENEVQQPKKRRRRRRRRRGGSGNGDNANQDQVAVAEGAAVNAADPSKQPAVDDQVDSKPEDKAQSADKAEQTDEAETGKPAKKTPRRRRRKTATAAQDAQQDAQTNAVASAQDSNEKADATSEPTRSSVADSDNASDAETAAEPEAEKPKRKRAARKTTEKKPAARKTAAKKPTRKKTAKKAEEEQPEESVSDAPQVAAAEAPSAPAKVALAEPAAVAEVEKLSEPAAVEPEKAKPKKRGWWSLGK